MKTITVRATRYVCETTTMEIEVPDKFEDWDDEDGEFGTHDEILEKISEHGDWNLDFVDSTSLDSWE